MIGVQINFPKKNKDTIDMAVQKAVTFWSGKPKRLYRVVVLDCGFNSLLLPPSEITLKDKNNG